MISRHDSSVFQPTLSRKEQCEINGLEGNGWYMSTLSLLQSGFLLERSHRKARERVQVQVVQVVVPVSSSIACISRALGFNCFEHSEGVMALYTRG